jgi:hypothetical protein
MGNQSGVDKKAEAVDRISCPNDTCLEFTQEKAPEFWVNKQAHQGKAVVTDDTEIRIQKTVDHPERHWWVISTGLLENLEPPLREHADLFDLLIALNLCTVDPVFFSQNPGQIVGGAYTHDQGALRYRDDLSTMNIATGLLGRDEIPERITITDNISDVFNQVRAYRSQELTSDDAMDIRVALHMYDDALDSDIWTATANLYFVCENVLLSGRAGQKDQLIAQNTALDESEARAWREIVNRLKHPDTGENVTGILDRDDLSMPPVKRLRQAANTVLQDAMSVN